MDAHQFSHSASPIGVVPAVQIIPFSGVFSSLFSKSISPETEHHRDAILQTIAQAYGLNSKVNIETITDSLTSTLNPKYIPTISAENLKLLQKSLENHQPSSQCEHFIYSLKVGELDGYIGLGIEGDKTGVEGSRTGGEGSRTGGEGSRTGGEGSRTGNIFSRPCVHPKVLDI